MIASGVKVYLASQPVDFRKGPDGLLSLVRDVGANPFSGALYVFRAKRADRIKIVLASSAKAEELQTYKKLLGSRP